MIPDLVTLKRIYNIYVYSELNRSLLSWPLSMAIEQVFVPVLKMLACFPMIPGLVSLGTNNVYTYIYIQMTDSEQLS